VLIIWAWRSPFNHAKRGNSLIVPSITRLGVQYPANPFASSPGFSPCPRSPSGSVANRFAMNSARPSGSGIRTTCSGVTRFEAIPTKNAPRSPPVR